MKYLSNFVLPILLFIYCAKCDIISNLNEEEFVDKLVYNATMSPTIENITDLSPCLIGLSWSCVECKEVLNFVVYWGEDGRFVVNNTIFNAIIDNLLAGTPYEVYVSALYAEEVEYASNSTVEYTSPEYPPPPTSYNCQTMDDDPTTMTITWSKPRTICPIINYYVESKGLILWNHSTTIHSEFSTELSRRLTGLVPHTKYTTTVRATFNEEIGYGESVKGCTLTTYEDVPGPPANLTTNYISPEGFYVEWRDPVVKNGIINGFNIYLNDTFVQFVNHSNSRKFETGLFNLKPSTHYRVTVEAGTGAGFGDPSEVEEETRAQPPPYEDDSSNLGLILGVTIPVIVVIVLVGVGFYFRDNIKEFLGNV